MRIEHLSKIYKSGSTIGVGLDDVSFTLPDKGLVFIVGKSGSGKSTLLNMIGGLDEITSGDIIIGEKRFSQFSNKDFDDYRNSYLGFVFQDFCLIDELSVEDNVRLALDMQGEKDTAARVSEILEKVELSEYARRKPTQLSGGQRQRVAIARALVKNPGLILADEPTGNLDSKTAVQVLELLKELSKDILVVIVSHNIIDAEKYADRIIELADGRVLSDRSRHERGDNVFAVEGDTVYIPDGVRMTDEEMARLNAAVADGAHIVQRDTAFSDTGEIADNEQNKSFKQSKLSIKRTFGVSRHFFRRKLISSLLMVLMITAVALLFGLSRTFVRFDGDATLDKAMREADSTVFVMRKGIYDDILDNIDTSRVVAVSDEDMQAFESTFSGKIYKKYPLSISIGEALFATESGSIPNTSNYSAFYAKESTGVLVCDEEYLTKIFGIDGELKVLAGDIYATQYPEAMIITDYIADSLMYYNKHNERSDSYDIFVNKELSNRGRSCAVIYTGYKEKYAELIQSYKSGKKLDKVQAAEFYEYANTYLNVGYSLNTNFLEAFTDAPICRLAKFNRVCVMAVGSTEVVETSFYAMCADDSAKGTDEMTMNVDLYNRIFGTSIGSKDDAEFVANEKAGKNAVVLNHRVFGSDEIKYSVTLKITDVTPNANTIHCREVAKNVAYANMQAFEVYFEEPTNVSAIYNVGEKNNYYVATEYFKTINSITKIVIVFRDMFSLIATCLCGIMILLMASFSFGNIRSRSYEIGVMKALGARTRNVAGIFLVQVIVMGLAICLLYGLVFYFGMPTANDILMDSLVEYVNNASITSITLLSFDSSVLWIGIGIILGVTLVAAIAPFVGVMAIKPVNIIKAKE